MSGGSSFNEVFLTDVRIPDDLRLGAVGQGWKVALTTLGFERGGSGNRGVGGSWERLLSLASWLGRTGDPVVRQQLASVYIHQQVRRMNAARATAATAAGQPPGPEGSIGKLLWVAAMTEIGQVAASLLGPRLIADTGEWGTSRGTTTSSARRATASRAVPTRSSATSSPSGSWVFPVMCGSTATCPGRRYLASVAACRPPAGRSEAGGSQSSSRSRAAAAPPSPVP